MEADLKIKKSTPLIRIGKHAGVVFSKHAITIFSYQAIGKIAQYTRHDFTERCGSTPKTAQLPSRPQNCIRPLQHSLTWLIIILHDVNRVEIFRVYTMPAQHPLRKVALQ